jgi:hypothetical protein
MLSYDMGGSSSDAAGKAIENNDSTAFGREPVGQETLR